MEREYIVTLKKDVNYDEFWDQMETNTSGLEFVPDRTLDIVDDRPLNLRNTHYALTNDEAELLRQDPRILGVEIPMEQRNDIKVIHCAEQSGNFYKYFSKKYNSNTNKNVCSYDINWGLLRSTYTANPTSNNDELYQIFHPRDYTPPAGNYQYHLDGTGVDIVIMDSGLQIDHPEFTDNNGVSRVQQINWYANSGITARTQPSNALYYTDDIGHGTHVTGIAAGKTYGWAKNSRIYTLKIPLSGGVQGTSIPINDAFDLLLNWHKNKQNDPVTGKKRPTVVNMSWGTRYAWYQQYKLSYMDNIIWNIHKSGSYRGTAWNDADINSNTNQKRQDAYGLIGNGISPFNSLFYLPEQYAPYDSSTDLLAQAGIIVCIAAGNEPYKHDLPTGLDYNNYVDAEVPPTYTGSKRVYYHRGSSPHTENGMKVGNISTYQIEGSTYQYESMVFSSRRGPGVNIWAPGTDIVSATSNNTTYSYRAFQYRDNENYLAAGLSGTSMASPQVAGIAALYLQINPDATPSEVKNFLINNSANALNAIETTDQDYSNLNSTVGGNKRFVYFPFASSSGITNTAKISARLNR